MRATLKTAALSASLAAIAGLACVAQAQDKIDPAVLEALRTTVPTSFPEGTFSVPPESGSLTTQKVIDEPNFVPIRKLPKSDPNYALSSKVGHLLMYTKTKSGDVQVLGSCSGSLVGHDLFLTNHHCVADKEGKLQRSEKMIFMEYLAPGDLGPRGTSAVVTDVLAADGYLDFALLKIFPQLGLKYGWLPVERDKNRIKQTGEVKIIQHPAGRPKEIVVDDTSVVRHVGKFIHYRADTEGGSSGSPVFALNGETIIGLHHVGTKGYNEAARIDVIAGVIELYLPDDDDGGQTSKRRSRSAGGASESDSDQGGSGDSEPAAGSDDDNGGWKAIN